MSLKRYIQVLAAFAAVFAFTAVAASSALAVNDAPRWTVAGKTPSAAESFPFHGVSTGSENAAMEQGKEVGKLEVPGLFTLTNPKGGCTVTGSIVGSAVDTPGTNKEVVLTCTEVDVEGLPKCIVESEPDKIPGTVKTTKLHSVLEWLEATGHRVGDTFTPPTGEAFATLTLTGAECIFNGLTTKVEGSIIGEIETPTTDTEVQSINFPTPPIVHGWTNATPRVKTATTDGLLVGAKAATFTNTFHITLNSKALWGVETG